VRFGKNRSATGKKIIPVTLIEEYLSPLDAPDNNMMKDTR
jgi:hypothetical protein